MRDFIDSRTPRDPRFWKLIEAYCDGSPTAAQWEELNAELAAKPEWRRSFLAYVQLHAELEWQLRGSEPVAAPLNAGLSPIDTLGTKSASPVLSFLGQVTTALHRPVYWSILAVGLVFGCYFAILAWDLRGRYASQAAAQQESSVADITSTARAQWSVNSPSSAPFGRVRTGDTLTLDSGMVTLKLKQGSVLTIEGPAQWSIEGENRARLNYGKLLAQVPRQARGFIVDTPQLRIVDLGTEFGLEVTRGGDADVQVLRGEIAVESSDGSAKLPRTVLVAGQCGQFGPTKTALGKAGMFGQKFQRLSAAASAPRQPQSDARFEVVFHYQVVDGKLQAVAGEQADAHQPPAPAAPPFLKQVGAPQLVRGTARDAAQYSMRLPGGPQPHGFVGSSSQPLPTDNFVLEAWGRSTSDANQILTYVGNSKTNGYGFALLEGKWGVLFGGMSTIPMPGHYPRNEWIHLALVCENNRNQLFVNGAPVAWPLDGAHRNPDNTIYVGHTAGEHPETFHGDIGEIRLIRLKRLFDPGILLWKAGSPD